MVILGKCVEFYEIECRKIKAINNSYFNYVNDIGKVYKFQKGLQLVALGLIKTLYIFSRSLNFGFDIGKIDNTMEV